MSEETPDKAEDQPEEAAAKKKSARKRSRTPEPKSEDKPVGETKEAPETSSEGKPAPAKAEKESGGGERAAVLEDGETPTENPSIRRISSKRKGNPDSSEGDDSHDQVPTIVEPPSADTHGKKRRRRRRKGSSDGDDGADEGRQSSRSAPRSNLDPDKVEKKAWKIFLSEVGEEGLALVSDQDAKEIGRRSFRLAEIFLEEASKRQ